jgi:HEAT repeat protein
MGFRFHPKIMNDSTIRLRACRAVAVWITTSLAFLTGCTDGPLWRSGYLSPWARETWAEEEELAETLMTKRQRLDDLVTQALQAGPAEQVAAADKLAEVATKDSVILVRMHAVRLLGQLPVDRAAEALHAASRDASPDVRMAAVDAWKRRGGDAAAAALVEMCSSDTNHDVRLASTRALAAFPQGAAVRAVGMTLDDPDPAIQMQATEALAQMTGQSLGADVPAWKRYLDETFGPSSTQTVDQASAPTALQRQ